MVAPEIIAPYLLNNYVWELLKANTTMRSSDYNDMVPIVMSGQEPEIEQFNKPFLVYGYSEDTTPDLYAVRHGSLSYAVYSTVGGDVNTILNKIRTAMEKHDETARSVNAYTSNIPAFVGLSFTTITVGYYEGPSPEETEGGRKAGVIILRYGYKADYDEQVKIYDPVSGIWA